MATEAELDAIFEMGREAVRRERAEGRVPALSKDQVDLLVTLKCPLPRRVALDEAVGQ